MLGKAPLKVLAALRNAAKGKKKTPLKVYFPVVAVAIAKNPVFHGRTKHFNIELHFVREMEQAQEVKLVHCSSEEQLVDILTKALSVLRFLQLRAEMGVSNMLTKEEC
ncbi:hypothetical protein PVK06_042595 [Gossypium arboreum]|uniref:Copia protein n=1 Tax=Gossypium arboreum TaxID=29729 RepID=A0ABR0MNP9_GOSAR|nr:hypothetical protein PVK06_042595 [Gossypium arboreum]